MRRSPVLLAAVAVLVLGTFVAPAEADAPRKDRPVVTVAGEPPAELRKTDIKRGTGPMARSGMTVAVRYVGVGWTSGREFDASWGRGPFRFKLGAGEVIPGFDRGVRGMRVGGRRRVDIPPALAYGDIGAEPAIAPDETLAFVIDLVRICRSARRCSP
jgi:peptidylprolyl isomerase